MGSIFEVIQEEFERLTEAKQAYEAAMEREAQGAPSMKRVGRKDYLYLVRREGPKVRFRYVGHAGGPEGLAVLESVKRRREYQKLLRGVKADLRQVEKVLRGRRA